MEKGKKKGNKKVKQSKNYDDLLRVRDTEDMGELIELSKSADPVVR
jgi:hypothetical protein